MKTPDKRATRRKPKGGQQQSAQHDSGERVGWGSDEPKQKDTGRTPPTERDSDYDPDGERLGGAIERP